jgi:tripartite-type tricarboxylate transporter receptor subunit TctC
MIHHILRRSAALLVAVAACAPALAQDFPTQAIRWIVPYSAGGGSDVTARVVAEAMRKDLGQNVLIENKPGAGTIIGTQALATSAADGYTISTADSGTLAYNPSLYSKLPYNIDKSFTYVGGLARMPLVLVTRHDLPVSSLKELLALAKKEPGKLTYASAGTGSPHHVAMEMFLQETGLKMVHIPYKGAAPAVQDLLSGQVDVMMLDMPGGISHMKAGKVKLMAVAMPERVAQLPKVPTMAEAGLPGFVAFAWQGVVAPAGTPAPVVKKLSDALTHALADAGVRKRLDELGVEPMPMSGADFAKYAKSESARWSKVIKAANIKLD